jgi:hypothetical protein
MEINKHWSLDKVGAFIRTHTADFRAAFEQLSHRLSEVNQIDSRTFLDRYEWAIQKHSFQTQSLTVAMPSIYWC